MINPRLDQLGTFMFWRLQQLLENEPAPAGLEPLALHVGEPQLAPPRFVTDTISAHDRLWGKYPPHPGTPEFRAAVAG